MAQSGKTTELNRGSDTSDCDDPLTDAIVAVLDLAVVSNGAVLECKLCRQINEQHTADCPIPLLEEFVNPR